MTTKTPTAKENAAEYMRIAYAHYEEWGHWVVETETLDELAAQFEAGAFRDVEHAIELAKIYADHAADIQATAW